MSLNRKIVRKNQEQYLFDFFGYEIDVPELPEYITNELINYWNDNIFHLHFMPNIEMKKELNLPGWKYKPSKHFYNFLKEGKIDKDSNRLIGKWILVDGRDRPNKKVPWFNYSIGNYWKKYFKKWKRQSFKKEYINIEGFGSRFCFTIEDIEKTKEEIKKFLKIDRDIRLMRFIEYNYLGHYYTEWRKSKTWEWLEDVMGDKHLAGGYKSIQSVAYDPDYFWSTQLTWRPIIVL